jgi:phage gp36-like protein
VLYCAITDVRMALSGSVAATGTQTASDLPDAAITDAITEASATIDAYVGGPYTATTATLPVPNVIKYWCRDIAAFLATATWRKSKDVKDTDPIVRRYNFVRSQLQLVVTGKLVVATPLDNQKAEVINPPQFQFPLVVVRRELGYNVL